MSAPITHLQEGQKLTATALVDLYQINLKNSVVVYRFKNDNTVSWQGFTYEGMACKMSGDSQMADAEETRPSLRILNPLGVFNESAKSGALDLAVVTRKRVLRTHLESNTNIFQQRMWYVGRISELISGQAITLDLRNMTDGPNFQIPVRMYIPPEFPMVQM